MFDFESGKQGTINLKNLHLHTAQEVFDASVAHILKQGRPSTVGEHCRYRSELGDKCAAGIFLSDEEATKFENLNWRHVAFKLTGSGSSPHCDLIYQLQKAHDAAAVIAHEELKLQGIHEELIYMLQGIHRTAHQTHSSSLRFLLVFINRARELAVAEGLSPRVLDEHVLV